MSIIVCSVTDNFLILQPDFSAKMENKNAFIIPVNGLALGTYSFRYEINDDFFADRDYSEVQQGRIDVQVDVDRGELRLVLHFDLEGTVRVACDRCADVFDLPIAAEQEFFLKLGSEAKEEADNVIVLPVDQQEFDLSDLIYEYIILAMPMQRVHPEGRCNEEMLQYLTEHEGREEEETETDPRWSALKNIKIEDN